MLVFIWKGRGYLVFLAAIAALAMTAIIANALHYRDATPPIYAIEILTTTILFVPIWIFGKKWNSTKRVLIDKKTGKEVIFWSRHSAFGIPMQYWAIIWPTVIAVIVGFLIAKQTMGIT